jgi:LAS superfamily LD-carboxypeptidase LdcB
VNEKQEMDVSSTIDQSKNHSGKEVQEESISPVFDLTYIIGKFDPSTHVDFDSIDLKYADRRGMFLRKDAYTDYKRMYDAALKEGVRLQIRSAARNFDYQKGIWERKWTGETKIESGKDASEAYPNSVDRAKQILLYSSMPGTSRHHWGTDIDLNSFNNDWFREGEGLKVYTWMQEHAHEFGFCQPYTDKTQYERTGYEEERWHWSYMPISEPLTVQAKKLLKNEMISGFLGSEVAPKVNMVDNYVLGVHPDCLSKTAPVTK